MAAPVTELVDFTLPDPATLDTPAALALLAAAQATLRAQPGCLGARFGLHHETKTADDGGPATRAATLFVDWDAVSSHAAFVARAAVFGPMKASLAPLAPAVPYHAALDPPTPTAGPLLGDDAAEAAAAPVVEVLQLYFPAASAGLARDQTALATLRGFAEATGRGAAGATVGTPALGWVVEERAWTGGEKARVAVLMVGWRSVEAHMAYRATEAFQGSIGAVRGLEGLLGMKMYHVSCGEA